MRVTHQFRRPATSALDYVCICRDQPVRDEESASEAEWLAVGVAHLKDHDGIESVLCNITRRLGETRA